MKTPIARKRENDDNINVNHEPGREGGSSMLRFESGFGDFELSHLFIPWGGAEWPAVGGDGRGNSVTSH